MESTAQNPTLTPPRIAALAAATLLLWLVTRPYPGVVQDARFYMVEALRAHDRARFANDLYFQFGSQGSFSIFPLLYRPLLGLLGIGGSGMILTVLGQLLWLGGLARLTRTLVGPRLMWLSMALVIGVVGLYAPYFSYGEAFVTPRLYAEALTMLALSLLAVRVGWALALLVLAALLHPLMALPGLGVAFVWLSIGRPAWWLVPCAGAVLAAGLGMAGIAPFSHLFQRMDPDWYAIVRLRELQCFLTAWPRDTLIQAFQMLGWGLFALLAVGPQHRRLLGAVLAVTVGALLCSWLGGDVAHNVFVIEVQAWRALWLLQVVARIYIPLACFALLAKSSFGALRFTTLLALVLILASGVTRLVLYPGSSEFTAVSLALEGVALAVIAAQLLLGAEGHRRMAHLAAALALALDAFAIWRWDNRAMWHRFIELPGPPPSDLAALLPPGATIFWEGSVETVWLRLRRASYFSCAQGTGAVFSRDTATTWRYRSDSFWPLRTSDFQQSDACAAFTPGLKQDRTAAGLANLCAREPKLDILVLSAPLVGVPAKIWRASVLFEDVHMSDGRFFSRITDRFYIYACKRSVSSPA